MGVLFLHGKLRKTSLPTPLPDRFHAPVVRLFSAIDTAVVGSGRDETFVFSGVFSSGTFLRLFFVCCTCVYATLRRHVAPWSGGRVEVRLMAIFKHIDASCVAA